MGKSLKGVNTFAKNCRVNFCIQASVVCCLPYFDYAEQFSASAFLPSLLLFFLFATEKNQLNIYDAINNGFLQGAKAW